MGEGRKPQPLGKKKEGRSPLEVQHLLLLYCLSLTFRELEAPTRLGLTVFLTPNNTRVTGKKATGLEQRAKCWLRS